MPFFKSNKNIFTDHGEYFESKWMESDNIFLPPTTDWSYDRELQIDDIDLWEVIHEQNFGIYAAWNPRAEFYMIMPFHWMIDRGYHIETFYGLDAGLRTQKRAKELGMILPLHNYWVDDAVCKA